MAGTGRTQPEAGHLGGGFYGFASTSKLNGALYSP